jgi:hypothetical protein
MQREKHARFQSAVSKILSFFPKIGHNNINNGLNRMQSNVNGHLVGYKKNVRHFETYYSRQFLGNQEPETARIKKK